MRRKEIPCYKNLHVKNLALIDESEVDFAGGIKYPCPVRPVPESPLSLDQSILHLECKVQKDMLRDPEKPALVELIFSVTEKQKQVLKQLDVETEDDEVILSRRITGGRGVSEGQWRECACFKSKRNCFGFDRHSRTT
ncbi:MAG: hypothetical protein ACLVCH_11870 [Roseburia inulinivorans]